MCIFAVAPLVGAWIEITAAGVTIILVDVAPLVGAWIEIIKRQKIRYNFLVAPLVGAWIEIGKVAGKDCDRDKSLLL